MNGSWRIGRLAGIDVFVHWTFLLLVGFLAIRHYTEHQDTREALWGLLVIVSLFAIIVAHELGHALAARRYGIQTRDITLLPIGGVARLERMPEKPSQELVVALAGPAVNVVLAAALFVGLYLNRDVIRMSEAARVGGSYLQQMLAVNVGLVIFNMLPAFPMDGGRVVRALLAMKLDYVRATRIAGKLGQAMAILFAVWGLFGPNYMLLFIALFVWSGAAQESSMVEMRAALAGIPVARAMSTQFHTVHPDEPVVRAADVARAGFQRDFPVVQDGELIGVVTRDDLSRALSSESPMTAVRDVMRREFETIGPRDSLNVAISKLQECDCRMLPVIDQDRLVGLLLADHVAEALMSQDASRNPAGAQPAEASV